MPGALRPARGARACQIACMASNAKFFVGGNWKCNGTRASVAQLVKDLNAGSVPSDVDIICTPSFLHLEYVKANLSPTYQVAAQNCSVKGDGAFTGEISAEMLRDEEVHWVILGHSERRAIFGEGNELVGAKVAKALSCGVGVIACIGETLEERNSGRMFDVLEAQMAPLLRSISDWSSVVLAYEPVWAIGTGQVASPKQAQEVHSFLRKYLANRVSGEVARSTRLIYGGSVNDGNCVELAAQEDIDGFLVGGASLKGSSFITICNANANAKK